MTLRTRRVERQGKDEAEYYFRCPACGGYFDMREAGQVFEHLGSLPHPSAHQPQ